MWRQTAFSVRISLSLSLPKTHPIARARANERARLRVVNDIFYFLFAQRNGGFDQSVSGLFLFSPFSSLKHGPGGILFNFFRFVREGVELFEGCSCEFIVGEVFVELFEKGHAGKVLDEIRVLGTSAKSSLLQVTIAKICCFLSCV